MLERLLIIKPSHVQLVFGLLSLLDQVTTAVDDLCFDQTTLILFARPLNNFNQSIDYLQAKCARIAVDVLFFENAEHLCYIRYKIECFMVDDSVCLNLLPQIVL